MKIMGLLQNQWFKDPERASATYAKHGQTLDDRAWLNGAYLFMGNGTTARRLKRAFGEECRDWVWENASPKIAGRPSGRFPVDEGHVDEIVRYHKPDVVILFGKEAQKAQPVIAGRGIHTIAAPHPAARASSVMNRLCDAAVAIDCLKRNNEALAEARERCRAALRAVRDS